MKNVFRIYLPSVCISFTFVVLTNIVINMASGPHYVIPASYLLALLGIIICIDIFDALISLVPFKTRFAYLVVTSLGEYAIVLLSTFLFKWNIFDPSIFIFTTLVFFGCLILIHTYFRIVHRYEAEEINLLLKNHEKTQPS